jgi:hypothetical protein
VTRKRKFKSRRATSVGKAFLPRLLSRAQGSRHTRPNHQQIACMSRHCTCFRQLFPCARSSQQSTRSGRREESSVWSRSATGATLSADVDAFFPLKLSENAPPPCHRSFCLANLRYRMICPR